MRQLYKRCRIYGMTGVFTDHSAVTNLQGLNEVEKCLGGLTREQEALTRGMGVVNVPCQIIG